MKGRTTRRARDRRIVSLFSELIETPAVGEFVLPADVKLFGFTDHPLVFDEDYVAVINGVNLAPTRLSDLSDGSLTTGVPADRYFPIGYFKRATTVQAFAGITLFIDAGLGRYVQIGGP